MEERPEVETRQSGSDRRSPISSSRRSSSTSEVPTSLETTDTKTDSLKPADDANKIKKSASFDSADAENHKKPFSAFAGSFKRRSIRRRSSKRLERPEVKYGHNTTEYEAIRERVLKERAVENAIEALQERWRMLMFMYEDCVQLNEGRKETRLTNLCIKRQYELIVIIILFLLICLPTVTLMAVFIYRVR